MITKTTITNTAKSMMKGGAKRENILQTIELMMKTVNSGFPKEATLEEVVMMIEGYNAEGGNLTQDIRDFVVTTNGNFSTTECQHCLHLTTRAEKKKLNVILGRLYKKEGLIEKAGKRNGMWRLVDNKESRIDFLSADTEELNISMPFGLEHWVEIYPKNIIVIAGAPDAGKTAFLLNLAVMNMKAHNVYYFSSEMGDKELRLRLSKFDHPLEEFSRVNWMERGGDFHDVIRPDDINIVDFLEVHEDFWRIGLMIKQIFDKLNKGVAFVALQKDKHKEHGLGGTRGLEKARLYLAMNPGELKIVKAKNWRDPAMNPNNKIFKFKLVKGCLFKYSEIIE